MASMCDITGKGKQFGHNVSFSKRRTKRVWRANLQKKTVIVDGQRIRLNLSTQAIRTFKKKGLLPSNSKPVKSEASWQAGSL